MIFINQTINLLIPFFTLCFAVVLIDRFTVFLETIINKVPLLPDKFEPTIAYITVFAISYLFCWRGHFDFFQYLNLTFNYSFEGWILTALLLSGGSSLVKNSFNIITQIPSSISYITSTISGLTGVGSIISTSSNTSNSIKATSNPDLPP